jgi:hypothetical protein
MDPGLAKQRTGGRRNYEKTDPHSYPILSSAQPDSLGYSSCGAGYLAGSRPPGGFCFQHRKACW